MADNNFLQAAAQKTDLQSSIKNIAHNALKKSINAGEAVVNILSTSGVAGFRFHIINSEQIKMENEITDHYIDTNRPVQDHIAQRPVTITLNGLHGEYFHTVHPVENMLGKVIPTMALVKQFLPKWPPIVKQKLAQRYKSITGQTKTPEALQTNGENNFSGLDLWKMFQDMYKLKSAQTRAYFFFEAMWRSRALVSIETSWKRFDNMAILSVVPLRDNNADITDFTITFKQIQKAVTKLTNLKNAAGRTRQQLAEVVNKGVDKGQYVETI